MLVLGIYFSWSQLFLSAGTWKVLYEEKFEQIKEGGLPEDFFVLDGEFEVSSKEGRKCLRMRGNPVGEHGFLFGPRLNEDGLEFSFSCLGGIKSRRHNVFAGAIGGAKGLCFRMNPSSQQVSFTRIDGWQKSLPVTWASSEWMRVFVQTTWVADKEFTQVHAHVSRESSRTDMVFQSSTTIDERIRSGKCMLWGFAYAEKEMYWDNLLIRAKN